MASFNTSYGFSATFTNTSSFMGDLMNVTAMSTTTAHAGIVVKRSATIRAETSDGHGTQRYEGVAITDTFMPSGRAIEWQTTFDDPAAADPYRTVLATQIALASCSDPAAAASALYWAARAQANTNGNDAFCSGGNDILGASVPLGEN